MSIAASPAALPTRYVDETGLLVVEPVGPVGYHEAWTWQREAHAAVSAGAGGRLFVLEHAAVYTAGKRTQPHERPTDGTPVVDVDRGGKITWHGPGQLVGYPIVTLPEPLDVVAYVRVLEGALIAACADLGLVTTRVDGRSGVWVVEDPAEAVAAGRAAERKVAAIGIRVSQGATMHGFALNCDCDLAWAAPIIPCGIPDAGVTSLTAELGRQVGVGQARDVVIRHVLAALDPLVSRRTVIG